MILVTSGSALKQYILLETIKRAYKVGTQCDSGKKIKKYNVAEEVLASTLVQHLCQKLYGQECNIYLINLQPYCSDGKT